MNPKIYEVLILSGSSVALLMLLTWLLSIYLRDASIVDLVWGIGFVLIAWIVFVFTSDGLFGDLLLPCLTTLWGMRLSLYLAWRNHGKPEDFRYQKMRESWGRSFPLASLMTVFCLQGAVMWLVSLPIQLGIAEPTRNMAWLSTLGTLAWAVGLFFESLGDWQLMRFKSDPKNRKAVLDVGLWRYTRHPNYFGDFLVWWGLYCVAYAQGAAWWTAIGPLTMSVFLMQISGVTMLEKTLISTKPDYAQYVARTNAFFPGPARS